MRVEVLPARVMKRVPSLSWSWSMSCAFRSSHDSTSSSFDVHVEFDGTWSGQASGFPEYLERMVGGPRGDVGYTAGVRASLRQVVRTHIHH